MHRDPAVAGRFYPSDMEKLTAEIRKHVEDGKVKTPVIGIVSPHAGFMYSGRVAGSVYSLIEIPDTVVLVGPNHTGHGHKVSVMTEGVWLMPFGDVKIDSTLAEMICEESSEIHVDSKAHLFEHSLETQIPFLQYFKKYFKIVPVCLMRLSFTECEEIARAVVAAVSRLQSRVLIVASSDMTHYESHDSASRKDRKAIDQILKMDARGLYQTVEQNGITMCGVNPVTVMLMCAEKMGARRSELVKYMTSGEVSGDMDQVVGYAGMIVQ
ncbi:MAG: AmmeMemoRadiSam system protein B [Nitrospinota bacterium]|nr:AmmeMemoRadiSam system protein B [Nitrospinota bacterium]